MCVIIFIIFFFFFRYFQCEPKHGLFAPLPKVEKLATAGSEGEKLKHGLVGVLEVCQ